MKEYISILRMNTTYPKNPNNCIMGAFKCDQFNGCWGQ
jgi:hypothetical protein